ncbi:RusA family crossover junction endodeoxyribonuclease [Mesorhizobium sp. WSM4310]|nr:RusA family crossover junction endodeoxyribonuclease [Mesorhizobium sp. WSM4310]
MPPKSDSKNPRQARLEAGWPRGDVDNLAMSVLDAMTSAGVWLDDSQVVELTCRKGYGSADGIRARVAAL